MLHDFSFFKVIVIKDQGEKFGAAWSIKELVLALYVYCQIPFSHCHARNEEVLKLAEIIGRTPGSVARKLGNFGSFDPLLTAKGIRGLVHASKNDYEVWNKYYGHWNELVADANDLLSEPDVASRIIAFSNDTQKESVIQMPSGPTSEYRVVLARRCQSFFRRAVLSSYRQSCCVCELDIEGLLIASHIVPWAENEDSRADPSNGLCLCVLHDKAFDSGFLSIDNNLCIRMSNELRSSTNRVIDSFFLEFEGKRMMLPQRFAPGHDYLQWHYLNRFIQ